MCEINVCIINQIINKISMFKWQISCWHLKPESIQIKMRRTEINQRKKEMNIAQFLLFEYSSSNKNFTVASQAEFFAFWASAGFVDPNTQM